MNVESDPSLPERRRYLVLLALGPTVWAAHFVLCYITAAVWCARFAGRGGTLGPIHTAIGWYTAVALAAIVWIGWIGYRHHGLGSEMPPHDSDSKEDRHRFLGFATFLLAGLSALATIYVAWATTFFGRC